jgi:hypothetical protein
MKSKTKKERKKEKEKEKEKRVMKSKTKNTLLHACIQYPPRRSGPDLKGTGHHLIPFTVNMTKGPNSTNIGIILNTFN